MQPKYCDRDYLSQLIQSWTGSVLIIGAVLFPVLEFMDYFVSPANFKRFIVYRFIVSGALIILYFLNKVKRSRAYQYAVALSGTVLCAATIELAVLQSGGQSSPYYAAMIILAICCLGFVPISMSFAFVLVGVIYGMYLAPILLTETITSGLFVSNNAFLISTFVIGILLRYNNQKLIMTELRLRAELSEDKRKLELYSSSLRDQVAEKTGELAVTEQKYRALFDHANDGIAVLDRKGNITDANQRFCELHGFGPDALIGTNYRLLEIGACAEDVEGRLERILGGESLVYEAEHFRKDGSRILLEVSARAIDIGGLPHIQSFHRDITEKRKLQEQVLQSQKMESMGVLAGGLAHDFNNILTAILGHTEVLRRHVNADEATSRRIKTVEDAARRAGQMVSKLLSFARKERLELAPMDLNAVVRDTMDLLGRALADRSTQMRLELEPDLPLISGDGIHLEQVIANLVLNAVDAMPQGGEITLSTSRIGPGAGASPAHPFLKTGAYAVLTVQDTGTGIPEEIRDRIFDPFFTTKPAGKGTGLGLAMVYGIVKSHKGEIRVESAPGEGTTFTIYLPVTDRPARRQLDNPGAFPVRSAAKGESVLVVDDEHDVLTYVRDILDHHGYLVFLADDPEYARYLFNRLSQEIDLVITDVVMPLMNGVELARAFKGMRPAVKVIGISGYDGDAFMREERNFDTFIKKPFDGASLLAAVRQTLDGGGTASEGV